MNRVTHRVDCPKAMTHGPCGGVRNDGSCEVDGRPCPFLEAHSLPRTAERAERVELQLAAPSTIVDVRAPARWRGDHGKLWQATAEALHGCVALLGEHADNAMSEDDSGVLTATQVIGILHDADVRVIATITGRDRDLVDATRLIHQYADAGVTAIHCVTGDHPAAVGFDRPTRFGAEAMTLIEAATDAGVPATVAESPASPGPRVQRIRAKQDAGASMCLLNHSGDSDDLIAFVDACRGAGATLPLIAPVAMVADRHAALSLAAFPGLRLPHGLLDEIIEADNPTTAGLDASREFIRACATSGRFGGINLSGGAGGHDPWERLELTSQFIELAREELGATRNPGRPS